MIQKLLDQSLDAVRHYDDVQSIKLIKKWLDLIKSENLEKKDPELYKNIQNILVRLYISAFPQLRDSEAADVLRFHFLDSFPIEIDMGNRLSVSLFSLPAIPRDELREKFRRALLENRQILGGQTVSDWIQSFEKAYPRNMRNSSAPVEFVVSNQKAQRLSPKEKEILKETIHIYDYYLVSTLPNTGKELNELLNSEYVKNLVSNEKPEDFEPNLKNLKTFRPTRSQILPQTQILNLPLNATINKYPETGEQVITSSALNLRSYPRPVPPSIKNWIFDYTFNMGHDKHDSMTRGRYIYQSENAKTLSTDDRQRLNYILKAYDEDSEVTIDTDSKQIIFPAGSQGNRQARTEKSPIGKPAPQIEIIPKKEKKSANPVSNHVRNLANEANYGKNITNPQETELPSIKNLSFNRQGGINQPYFTSKQKNAPYQTPERNYQTSLDRAEPEDIFETQKMNERNFFDGHIARSRQWTGLGTMSNEQRPANNQITNSQKYQIPNKEENYQAQISTKIQNPNIERQAPYPRPANPGYNVPAAKIDFSSPQKFQAENPAFEPPITPVKPQPLVIKPGANRSSNNIIKLEEKKPEPKNVVNLKETDN